MAERTGVKPAAVRRRATASHSTRKHSSVLSEEECLRAEIQELDTKNPYWYEPNLIAGAKRLLQDGNKFEVVAAIYGRRITEQAQKSLNKAAFGASQSAQTPG